MRFSYFEEPQKCVIDWEPVLMYQQVFKHMYTFVSICSHAFYDSAPCRSSRL